MAESLWTRWFLPEVDVFASRVCHLLPNYYSGYLDSEALTWDAFSVMRWPARCYCFPPVPLIPMMLDKIKRDEVLAIIVVPCSRTVLWWNKVTSMLVEVPVFLGQFRKVLWSPMGKKIPYRHQLVACFVAGSRSIF